MIPFQLEVTLNLIQYIIATDGTMLIVMYHGTVCMYPEADPNNLRGVWPYNYVIYSSMMGGWLARPRVLYTMKWLIKIQVPVYMYLQKS